MLVIGMMSSFCRHHAGARKVRFDVDQSGRANYRAGRDQSVMLVDRRCEGS
jgi:hypothetical protein